MLYPLHRLHYYEIEQHLHNTICTRDVKSPLRRSYNNIYIIHRQNSIFEDSGFSGFNHRA